MPSFNNRSYQKELLDLDDIPFEDIRRNMQELDTINSILGGHAITICGLKKLVKDDHKELKVVEIGCGGGDNLRALKKWSKKHNKKLQLAGVDINPECIRFAKNRKENTGIDFICSDYRDLVFDVKPDIIFSSLFCHHFTDEQLVQQLQWLAANTKVGFFINDLQRHPLAYYFIKYATKIFSKSYLVKNDAALSVRRGFKKKEWKSYLNEAGIKQYDIKWKWAFRWLITCQHER